MGPEHLCKYRSKSRPVVVIDTREQRPFSFDPECVSVQSGTLGAGDYALLGFEDRIAVERKSMEDFVSTVVGERARFKRELAKLQTYELACVVVEGDLRDVIRGSYRSRAHPNAVFASALAIYTDYGIPVFFCSDREIAARFVMGLLLRFHQRMSSSEGEDVKEEDGLDRQPIACRCESGSNDT